MNIQREYADFYLEGRQGKIIGRDVIDVEKLAERVLKGGGEPYVVVRAAVLDAAKELEFGRHKKSWVAQNEDDVKDAKLSVDTAFSHYLAGRVDESCAAYEEEVVDVMTDIVNDGDDDEDEDDDDEDDEGDDKDKKGA